MRGLLVSDLHYSLKQLDWLRETSPQFDLVVVAGDTLDIASTVALGAQIVVVSKYLKMVAQKTRLVASSGNHDLNVREANGERVASWLAGGRLPGVLTDGEYAEIGDVSISVTRWWDGPQGCAEVVRQLRADAERRKGRWIWVYHAPPDASPVSWTGSKHYGDTELVRLIGQLQPDIVLSGHVIGPPSPQPLA